MQYEKLLDLMDRGHPVGTRFTQDISAPENPALFCELVQQARRGESFSFSGQGCPVGAYVLGRNASPPDDYYFSSGRYMNKTAAYRAARSLPQLDTHYNSVELFPITDVDTDFDIMLLFLPPARAMRLVQALSYNSGSPVGFLTGGTASVCGDCTVMPLNTRRMSISMGCKGSRKHSRYGDNEVVVGIPHLLIEDILVGLTAIPGIFD